MEDRKNIVTCLKWGTKYDAEYVNVLYSMVKRNLTLPYEFYCITENAEGINPEINILPLYDEGELRVHKQRGWWYKLMFFKEKPWNLTGRMLFLDLDIIIVDNIDCFLEPASNFTIIKEWFRKGYQSSVFTLDLGTETDIWKEFNKNTDENMKKFHGDQEWIFHYTKKVELYPDSWVKSYKYHCKDSSKPAKDAKIISFHGNPNPDIAHLPFGNGKKYPPAHWAPTYWRE